MLTALRGHAAVAALTVLALPACGPAPEAEQEPVTEAVVAVVHRSPTCECCAGHETHLADQGFTTEEELHEEDLAAWKEARGIPPALWSCHTIEVGGYLVEGHVPAETVARLLAEQPDIAGIALPGMPAGSPGMGGVREEPLVVEAFVDGAPAGVFAIQE